MRKVVFLLVSIMALSQFNVYAADVKVVARTVATTEVKTEVDEEVKAETKVEEKKIVEYGMEIDFDKAEEGVVSVFYYQRVPKKMKLVVQLEKERYVYNLFNNDEPVNYPLQLGEGEYTVSIYENTTGSKYKRVARESHEVEFEDENSVYLQSVLEINWDEEDESIKLAEEFVANALEAKIEKTPEDKRDDVELTESEIIEVIYQFVIETVEYDFEKIKDIDYSYLPVNDNTIETAAGICYDYSSLFASMLRSQGIPSKMIKGYAKTSDVYHAWNEVYLSESDEWIVVDTTYDAYMEQNNKKYSFEKEAEDFNKVKEF